MLSSFANDSYMSGVFPNAFQSFTHLILMPSLWGRCHYFAHFTGEEMEPEKSPKLSSQQMTESRIPPRCLTPSFSYSVELLLWGKKVRKWKLINYFRQWDAQILASCPGWAGFSGKGPAGFNGPAGTGRAIGWLVPEFWCPAHAPRELTGHFQLSACPGWGTGPHNPILAAPQGPWHPPPHPPVFLCQNQGLSHPLINQRNVWGDVSL